LPEEREHGRVGMPIFYTEKTPINGMRKGIFPKFTKKRGAV
jgi:hypothetical protein